MKIIVYTCIVGDYDRLSKVAPGQGRDVDFICFTDNPQLSYQAGNWSVVGMPPEVQSLPLVKQQRVVKACPQRYLPPCDASLWVDGNISILCDVERFILKYDLRRTWIYAKGHPLRKCVFAEAKAVLNLKKDIKKTVDFQMERYRKEGLPLNNGLHETGILLRRSCQENQLFGNLWAKEIMEGSHRDQLSFDYCKWKLSQRVGLLKVGNLLKDENFRWRRHGK